MFGDIFAIIGMAAPFVIQAEAQGGDNTTKKAQVVSAITAEIEKPGGLDYPSWVPVACHGALVSACIEVAVFLFNRAGGPAFLKK